MGAYTFPAVHESGFPFRYLLGLSLVIMAISLHHLSDEQLIYTTKVKLSQSHEVMLEPLPDCI